MSSSSNEKTYVIEKKPIVEYVNNRSVEHIIRATHVPQQQPRGSLNIREGLQRMEEERRYGKNTK